MDIIGPDNIVAAPAGPGTSPPPDTIVAAQAGPGSSPPPDNIVASPAGHVIIEPGSGKGMIFSALV